MKKRDEALYEQNANAYLQTRYPQLGAKVARVEVYDTTFVLTLSIGGKLVKGESSDLTLAVEQAVQPYVEPTKKLSHE